MYIFWTQGVSGDFATASNWTPAAVPGPADDAIIIGLPETYTVTSSINETVDSLDILNAELFITGTSSFTIANRGVNDGTIAVDSGSALNVGTSGESTTLTNLGNIDAHGQLLVAGDVSLQGRGKVTLSDGTISSSVSGAATTRPHASAPDRYRSGDQAARRTPVCSAQAHGRSWSSFWTGQPFTSLTRISAR